MKTYDAGREREALAQELAGWTVAGFMDSRRAERWHRRMRRLAKASGMTVGELTTNLNADADLIVCTENLPN